MDSTEWVQAPSVNSISKNVGRTGVASEVENDDQLVSDTTEFQEDRLLVLLHSIPTAATPHTPPPVPAVCFGVGSVAVASNAMTCSPSKLVSGNSTLQLVRKSFLQTSGPTFSNTLTPLTHISVS